MKYFIFMFLISFSSSSFASNWKSFEGTYQTNGSADCYDRLEIMYRPISDVEAIEVIFMANDNAVARESITEGEFATPGGGSTIGYEVENQFVGHYVSLVEISQANELVKKMTFKIDKSDGNSIDSLEFSYAHIPTKVSKKCLYTRKF